MLKASTRAFDDIRSNDWPTSQTRYPVRHQALFNSIQR